MTTAPSFTYRAVVENVVDADTIDVNLDLGMRVHFRTRLRVAHIDAPERYTTEGRAAADFVRALLPVDTEVTVTTYKPDKYGRALADIQLPDDTDLATLLLEHGHAVEYEGGARTT